MRSLRQTSVRDPIWAGSGPLLICARVCRAAPVLVAGPLLRTLLRHPDYLAFKFLVALIGYW